MENFNNGFDSSLSFKGNKSNDENELNPEMTSKIKSPRNKQFPPKNFMNPTISATIKASVPRKKILGERNETLDPIEQPRLQRSSSFGSRLVKSAVVDSDGDMEKDLVGGSTCLQPYDPVKNYLSPRPKFLRYNPDRRRKKILNLQENDEDRVKISTYFDAGKPSSDLQLGFSDSCSEQESVEETHDVNNEEDEECEEDEEEMIEFEEDSFCSLRGFLKFLFVVIAVILTTQAICSMNSPSVSQNLESVWGFRHSYWQYGVHGLNFSEVGVVCYGPIKEPDLLVGELNGGDAYYSSDMSDEFVVVQDEKTVHQDEVQNDNSIVIQDEIQLDYVEAETVFDLNQDGLTEEDDSETNESNLQLTNEAELEVMEDVVDPEFDDTKTKDVLIKFTTLDPTIAVLIGHILILTFFSVIYCSKHRKSSVSVTSSVKNEEFNDLEPSTNPESMIQKKDELVTQQHKDISKVHNIPSVELLGEFVFGEEMTSNISSENHSTNFLIQTTAADSHTIKKQRRKNAENITPSSSVRRSSRLRTRSVMSP